MVGRKFSYLIGALLVAALLYSRFVGLDWGLPYPMHPDERNMAVSITQLACSHSLSSLITDHRLLSTCFNPNFFAYGQFPLYLAFALARLYQLLSGGIRQISYDEATVALRIISAASSVLNAFVMIKIIALLKPASTERKKNKSIFNLDILFFIFSFSFIVFSPYFIQFSHFGTTESLLMLFYSILILFSLFYLNGKTSNFSFLIINSFVAGLALATKVSSLPFLAIPLSVLFIKPLINKKRKDSRLLWLKSFIPRSLGAVGFSILYFISFSPHTFISWKDFLSSLNYESAVGLGKMAVFYTRQFDYSAPVIFQMVKIFPYVLGWPQFLLAAAGFLFLPWKDKGRIWKRYVTAYNLLRFAFLVYFLPSAFTYAKWTRFMAPIFPIMTLFAILFISHYVAPAWTNIKNQILKIKTITANGRTPRAAGKASGDARQNAVAYKKYLYFSFAFFIFSFLFIILLIPGIAYLSIYSSPDVRFTASKWIYQNIPSGSTILSETANVIDIPVPPPTPPSGFRGTSPNYKLPAASYNNISFDYYNLHTDYKLKYELDNYLETASYVFVPSRRIFANHTCLWPIKNEDLRIKNKENNNATMQQYNNVPGYSSQRCSWLQVTYPELNRYYRNLFSGQLGYKQVAEFASFPQICLFKAGCLKLNDESAEETWTVFDHPVIRIYKRV